MAFEIGTAPTVDQDLAPTFRACDDGDAHACAAGADLAARYGNPELADHLTERACYGGLRDRCPTDLDRCTMGDAAACRRLLATRTLLPSGAGLAAACAQEEPAACALLEEHGLDALEVSMLRWDHSERVDDVWAAPDGQSVLVSVGNTVQHVRNGAVVRVTRLPSGWRARFTGALWTADTLFYAMYGSVDDQVLRGFYRNGAYLPVPDDWSVPENTRCYRVYRKGSVVHRTCRQKGEEGARVLRMTIDGTALPAFDVPSIRAAVVGAGPEPGSLYVRLDVAPYLVLVGPEADVGEPVYAQRSAPETRWSMAHPTDQGRVLVSNGNRIGAFDPNAEQTQWYPSAEDADLIALGPHGWLWSRETREAGRRVRWLRIDDPTGPRTEWFRADLLLTLGGYGLPHPAGFFVWGHRRGAVVRLPGTPDPGPGLAPVAVLRGLPTPPVAEKVRRFRKGRGGWPRVGGPLAPATGPLTPTSLRMQDVPGVEAALLACAEGQGEACDALLEAWPASGPHALRKAIEDLPCDTHRPSGAPRPISTCPKAWPCAGTPRRPPSSGSPSRASRALRGAATARSCGRG